MWFCLKMRDIKKGLECGVLSVSSVTIILFSFPVRSNFLQHKKWNDAEAFVSGRSNEIFLLTSVLTKII